MPLVLVVFYRLRKINVDFSSYWLVLVSFFFYGYSQPHYLGLLVLSILVNFFIAQKLCNETIYSIWILRFGIALNIFLLFMFKYYNFTIENFNKMVDTKFEALEWALPIGISFYTIQQITYLIDVYQDRKPVKKLSDYSLAVSFFPTVLSGPITSVKIFNSQIIENKIVDLNSLGLGIFIFVMGLFKKVYLADALSGFVENDFNNPSLSFISAWLASLTYTFQLYFDFCGYSEMAVGIAKMFQFDLTWNFESPYKAKNLIDFWKRWHISVSQVITGYVFTPYIRSFKKITFGFMLIGVLGSMTISGIWHGASWTYIVWGVLHGLGLCLNHIFKKRKWNFPNFLSPFVTFLFVNFSFVLFRAPSIDQGFSMLLTMLGGHSNESVKPDSIQLNLVLLSMGICFLLPNLKTYLNQFKFNFKQLFLTTLFFIMSILYLTRETEFLYFNF